MLPIRHYVWLVVTAGPPQSNSSGLLRHARADGSRRYDFSAAWSVETKESILPTRSASKKRL